MISNRILEVEIEIAVEDKLVPKYMQHVRLSYLRFTDFGEYEDIVFTAD